MENWPQDVPRDARTEEIANNLSGVRRRIEKACAAAGRADDVTLIVVTKFFPVDDAKRLIALGAVDLGENRDQEASAKMAELKQWSADNGLDGRMHFVGQLQTNKANSVMRYADVVHSVDRVRLVNSLNRAAGNQERRMDVLLQVDLRPAEEIEAAPGRGGVAPGDLAQLAEAVKNAEHLDLKGLMSVAPLGEDPRAAFARLTDMRSGFLDSHPDATWLSAGMSADLEEAVEAGATHVRVGSAILGERPLHG